MSKKLEKKRKKKKKDAEEQAQNAIQHPSSHDSISMVTERVKEIIYKETGQGMQKGARTWHRTRLGSSEGKEMGARNGMGIIQSSCKGIKH